MNLEYFCVSSVTHANKAKRILQQNGIWCQMAKSDCGLGVTGCSYEIAVDEAAAPRAAWLLDAGGVHRILPQQGEWRQ